MSGTSRRLKGLLKKLPLAAICAIITSLCLYLTFRHYTFYGQSRDLIGEMETSLLDLRYLLRGRSKPSGKVGILAIDEKSIQQFKRWPFSRRYYRQAFQNLKKIGVRWIGFDAVFAEPESASIEDIKEELSALNQLSSQPRRSWPASLKKNMQSVRIKSETAPGDQIMAQGLREFENIVLGYFYFETRKEVEIGGRKHIAFKGLDQMLDDSIQAVILPENMDFSSYPDFLKAYGLVSNISPISQASSHFAFFSNEADQDAIVRWVSLVKIIDGNLMPSLSLKVAAESMNRDILVIFDSLGVESIELVSRDDESDSLKIPVDPFGKGRAMANYKGPGQTFPHYSLADAYNDSYTEAQKESLKDSVLLLGMTAIGINDQRPNPFDPSFDGVEIHATMIDNIISRDFMQRPKSIFNIELLILLLIGLVFSPILIFSRATHAGIVGLLFLIGYYYFDKTYWFGNGIWAYIGMPYIEIFSLFVSITLYKYITEEKDKKFLKEAFGSYISPELIEDMYASGEPPKLGGTSDILTAFFTDIQGFSSFSEKLTATQLVELLNEYLTAMTDILLENKGTLDKYEGDAIIAFFGAPMPLKDHAVKACTVAIRMQEELLKLRKKWISEGDKWPLIVHEMRMRIGINSGDIVTGNMGSRDRMNYTMMGDSVNLAARLEEAAKQYGIFTQVSSFTKDLTGDAFDMRELDTIRVVGKSEPVTTFDLLGIRGETSELLLQLMNQFHKGLELYKNRKWEEAITVFRQSLELEYQRYPDLKGKKTNPSLIYIDRCENFIKNPPPEDWDKVYVLTSK